MPTYDYQCKSCGHKWELFQSITAQPEKKCPECGKKQAERVIGPGAGIIFRGSGFYQTDYRSEKYKKAAEADRKSQESGSKSESNGSGGTKSETKSESKKAKSRE